MDVYLVIDDYMPGAGSYIYGCFATREEADEYARVGVVADYDLDSTEVDNIEVRELPVEGR